MREFGGVAKKGGLVPANEKGKWSLAPPLEPHSLNPVLELFPAFLQPDSALL